MEKMDAALNIHNVCRAWQSLPDNKVDEWQRINPTAWEHIIEPLILRQLEEHGTPGAMM